jgi:DNA-binding transcriptional regulator YiaG
MTRRKRNVGREIIADLKAFNADLRAGVNVREKYAFRSAQAVPDPGNYDAAGVKKTRALVGVSQPVFARMLGVSPALVRAWEIGQRKPAPIARRLLDLIRANPSNWRAMVEAA